MSIYKTELEKLRTNLNLLAVVAKADKSTKKDVLRYFKSLEKILKRIERSPYHAYNNVGIGCLSILEAFNNRCHAFLENWEEPKGTFKEILQLADKGMFLEIKKLPVDVINFVKKELVPLTS